MLTQIRHYNATYIRNHIKQQFLFCGKASSCGEIYRKESEKRHLNVNENHMEVNLITKARYNELLGAQQ